MKKLMKLLMKLLTLSVLIIMSVSCKIASQENIQITGSNIQTDSFPASTASDKTLGTGGCRLPSNELKNKKISIYSISDSLDEWRSHTIYPGVIELMEKEYGAEFKVVGFADWDKQYEKMTTLYMANDMPDLNLAANFPRDLANNFVQPLDNLIDFSGPMWDDVRDIMDMIKWKGKNYFSVRDPLGFYDWFFYNPQLFEANNVKSPLEYYKEGNWDWNAVTEVAKQLTQDLDGDGNTDQWGLGWATGRAALHSQTGVPLVEITHDGNVKENLRDPKIAAAANYFRSLGPSQYNVMLLASGDITQTSVAQQFGAGKIAMFVGGWWWGGNPALIDNWKKGTVDIVPMPKWPGEKTNYLNGQISSLAVCNKAKNPEGAALFIQVDKYTSTDAYREKYMPNVDPKIDVVLRDNWGMNDRQLEMVYDIRHIKAPAVPNLYWIFWSWEDGFDEVLTKPWSQVLEEVEPIAQKSIDNWMTKLKDK